MLTDMCLPAGLPGIAQAVGIGSLVRPIAKPFFAHNGLDSVNKAIYGGSGKSKAPTADNPLAIKEPGLATPLGTKVGSGYTSSNFNGSPGYNGLQI